MKKNTISIAIGFGVLMLLATGCAVHRSEPVSLTAPVPDTFNENPDAAAIGVYPDRWWEIFGDDTLNELMDKAFGANLDLAQAYSRLKQLESVAKQSDALRYPTVNLDAGASRDQLLNDPRTITGNVYNMSLAAAFEVDLWNKLKSGYQARLLETGASLEDIRSLYLTLSAQVTDLYFLRVEQRAQLELTDRTVTAREATVELVEQRYVEGMVSALDVYQARQALAAARSRRPVFEQNLAIATYALSVLIGEYPDPESGGNLSHIPYVSELFPTGLPSSILASRPDIQADLLRLKARDKEIGVAIADRFPSINLLADYGRYGSDFGPSLSGNLWGIAGNLMLPLIDWGRRKAEVERTQAAFQEQLDRYRQTVLIAFREVEDALVSNRKTEEQIGWLKDEETSADSALRLASDRYLDGLSDYLPVLTAQGLFFDVQNRLLSTRRQLVSNRVSLVRALGGNWMDVYIKERLDG
jgi:NodT family efflux transporter outer membrane factor (OMF) lipoprotein